MANSWHRILLLGVLLALAGGCGWVALEYPDAVNELRAPLSGKGAGHKVDPLSADSMAARKNEWISPTPWNAPDSGDHLFTSRRFLFFPDPAGGGPGKIQLAGPDVMVAEKIPLDWLIKNGMGSIANDPNVANMDPDGDGFSILDEFLAQTDPRDPKSHPAYAKLLRVKSSEATPFKMTFVSVNEVGGDKIFQVNTPNGHPTSNNKKKGESFQGFKIVDYRQKTGTKMIGGMPVEGDISELELQNETTGASIVLIYREEQNVPNVSASFILILPGLIDRPVTVQQGRVATIQAVPPNAAIPPENVQFQLLSVDSGGAKVANPETKEEWTVPRLAPGDMDRLPPPPAPASASP